MAIDWADKKHYWKFAGAWLAANRAGRVGQHAGSDRTMGTELHLCFEGRPLAVALEQRRGALVAMHLLTIPQF